MAMTNDTRRPLYLFTDGACQGNQSAENVGGWGAVLEYGAHRLDLSGAERNTTNNRMEMIALIEGIQAIRKPRQRVVVFSDSSYLIRGLRERWYNKWLTNQWRNSHRQPVENQDLWRALIELLSLHDYTFNRVKGHLPLHGHSSDLDGWYRKFVEWNGAAYSYDDFLHITEQNHQADALAGAAIDRFREELAATKSQ